MKLNVILSCILAAGLTLAASAQDLRPARDRQTRKYGYQARDKSWVIEPRFDAARRFVDGFAEVELDGRKGLIDAAGDWILEAAYDDIGKFDKNGLCELMVKEGRTKLRGVADQTGRIILPVDCRTVNIPRNGGFITAQREVREGELAGEWLWGVYGMDGREVYAPQFLSSPSFSDGTGIAKSALNGLTGVVDDAGGTLLPFDFLAVTRSGSGFRTLGTDFTQTVWDASLRRGESFHHPGAVIPYDPMDDPVRAAAWHNGAIGVPLHRNQVWSLEMRTSRSGYCRPLRLDWSFSNRFLRLEPFADEEHGTMEDPVSGRRYTLKALLYEPDGSLAGEASRWGWLEAECNEGVIYHAEDETRWLIMSDPNALDVPSFSLTLTGWRDLGHEDIYAGLGLRSAELEQLADVRRFAARRIEIIEGDNVGVTSYLPPELPLHQVRQAREAMAAPLFNYPFRMGEVVNCSVRTRSEGVEVELYENLVCAFDDRFQNPSYSMDGEEVIWWGPHNARTVRLALRRGTFSSDGIADDVHGTEASYLLVLEMYEEDGTWLRDLAVAQYADYAQDGIIVFERLGIALLTPEGNRTQRREQLSSGSWRRDARGEVVRTVKLPGAQRLPRTLSALEEAARPHFGARRSDFGGRRPDPEGSRIRPR